MYGKLIFMEIFVVLVLVNVPVQYNRINIATIIPYWVYSKVFSYSLLFSCTPMCSIIIFLSKILIVLTQNVNGDGLFGDLSDAVISAAYVQTSIMTGGRMYYVSIASCISFAVRKNVILEYQNKICYQ